MPIGLVFNRVHDIHQQLLHIRSFVVGQLFAVSVLVSFYSSMFVKMICVHYFSANDKSSTLCFQVRTAKVAAANDHLFTELTPYQLSVSGPDTLVNAE